MNTLNLGHSIESKVADYLSQKGINIIKKNYSCKMGEIDIIAEDKEKTIIFIEVRYKASDEFGSALESVDAFKQSKLKKTAQHYLQAMKIYEKVPCRFDVIGVRIHKGKLSFDWIEDAF